MDYEARPWLRHYYYLHIHTPPILCLLGSCTGGLNMKQSIATFLGVLPLYKYIYEGYERLDTLEGEYETYQGQLFILEDGP